MAAIFLRYSTIFLWISCINGQVIMTKDRDGSSGRIWEDIQTAVLAKPL